MYDMQSIGDSPQQTTNSQHTHHADIGLAENVANRKGRHLTLGGEKFPD